MMARKDKEWRIEMERHKVAELKNENNDSE